MSEGKKNPIEAVLPYKVVDLATLATMHNIDREANLELMKAVDQEEMVTVMKIPHHAKW